MKRRRKAVSGIGIDAVELARASRFMRAHSPRIGSVLNAYETCLVRGSRSPSRAFAILFALKEAASKSLGVRIDHPRQFRSFTVRRSGAGFRVRYAARPRARIELVCFSEPGSVGAFAAAREGSLS